MIQRSRKSDWVPGVCKFGVVYPQRRTLDWFLNMHYPGELVPHLQYILKRMVLNFVNSFPFTINDCKTYDVKE